jgi:hypothetical protein
MRVDVLTYAFKACDVSARWVEFDVSKNLILPTAVVVVKAIMRSEDARN